MAVLLSAENLRHRLVAESENLLQLRLNEKRANQFPERAEREDVVNAIAHLGAPAFQRAKSVLVIPQRVRPDALLIHKMPRLLDVRDFHEPGERDAEKRAHAILDHHAGMHLRRQLHRAQKGERKPITFRRPLNLALVISDISKAGYHPINAGKNLICEGTKPLCCHAVTVAHHPCSGIAAKQPN